MKGKGKPLAKFMLKDFANSMKSLKHAALFEYSREDALSYVMLLPQVGLNST